MPERRVNYTALGLLPSLLVALAVLMLGCRDVPIIEDNPAYRTAPTIMIGPYLTERNKDSVVVRMRTNRESVAGVSMLDQGENRMFRFSASTKHRLPMDHLPQESGRQIRIYVDEYQGPVMNLKPLPPEGAPVTIAFAGGREPERENMLRADRLLVRMPLEATVFLDQIIPPTYNLDQWATRFFQPLRGTAMQAPFLFAAGIPGGVPTQLFPRSGGERVFWSRDIGCVHLVSISGSALRNTRQQDTIIRLLEEDLKRRPVSTAWTVLILSEPLLGARHVNARGMAALRNLLEDYDVSLVVSGGEPYYHRSLPLGVAGRGQVRYLVASGLSATPQSAGSGREYTAKLISRPHVSVLEASLDQLTWTTHGLEGGVLDKFTLSVDPQSKVIVADTGEPVQDKGPILDDALSVVTLRQEVLLIARQASLSVTDPSKPQPMNMRLRNPTTRPFVGKLLWQSDAEAAWGVEPSAQEFELAPGQEAEARFRIWPLRRSGTAPIFAVSAAGIGHTKHPLVVTLAKRAQVPFVEGEVTIDGRFEPEIWGGAASVTDFEELYTGENPPNPTRAWLAYNAQGLLVAMRCGADNPRRIRSTVKTHDGPVHRDESVEVFVDPTARRRDFMQFAVNVQETQLDRSSRLGLKWNPAWQAKRRYGSNRVGGKRVEYYDIEMLIPYAALGRAAPPRPGSEWLLNMTRNDYEELREAKRERRRGENAEDPENKVATLPGADVTQWAQTLGSNARVGCYGRIRFLAPGEKPEENPAEKPAE